MSSSERIKIWQANGSIDWNRLLCGQGDGGKFEIAESLCLLGSLLVDGGAILQWWMFPHSCATVCCWRWKIEAVQEAIHHCLWTAEFKFYHEDVHTSIIVAEMHHSVWGFCTEMNIMLRFDWHGVCLFISLLDFEINLLVTSGMAIKCIEAACM